MPRARKCAGSDPGEARRTEKSAQADNFEAVSKEWLARQKKLDEGTMSQLERRLEKYVWPMIGKKPIGKVTAADVLRVLRKIEANGTHETAHRVRSVCGRVLRYCVATEKVERDVTADLRGALTPVKTTNFAAVTDPKRIGQLLRAIAGYDGQPTVKAALSLAALVFVRPGELRGAEWQEFDFDAAEWRIPAIRMKMRRDHIVPLSSQAIAILKGLRIHTGSGKFLFASLRTSSRPISENTLNAALRRLGYAKDEMTTHGFRSVASTRLNELGYSGDLIELQLAHLDRNRVRSTYNRAERLGERRTMMQAWSDHLDCLRESNYTGAGECVW
jgi:integrase